MIVPSIPQFNHSTSKSNQGTPRASNYARTPSCEPPSTAIIPEVNTSLLSLIEGYPNPSESESDDTFITHHPKHHHRRSFSAQEAPTYAVPSHTENSVLAPISTSTFHTISTTTRIPLAPPVDITPPAAAVPTDALSPTMSREEALAQIRERRGRARSLAQGTVTPRKPIGGVEGGMAGSMTEKRDFSAPAVRSGGVRGRLGMGIWGGRV